MKKVLNSKIFIVIITMVICISGTLYATNVYKSEEVIYTPKNSEWSVENVKSALDDLYSMKTELDTIKGIGDATAGDIASGKTAVVKGEKVTGTKVEGTNYKVYEFKNVEATASDDYHATYKDAAWVPITYAKNYDCSGGVCSKDDGVKFSIDIGFTPKKIVAANICLTVRSATKEPYYNIRMSRGYDTSTSSTVYWYTDKLCTNYTYQQAYQTGPYLEHLDTVNSEYGGSFGINTYYVGDGKLSFESDWMRNVNSSGNDTAGTTNSGYQVYGTLFYLSGTIVYEE